MFRAFKPKPPVTVFTTPGCSACAAVKRFLEHKGVAYIEKDVAADPAHLEEMKRLSGIRIAPVTVVGKQTFYGTFEQQKPKLQEALRHLGESV